jgi:hypothetical protein
LLRSGAKTFPSGEADFLDWIDRKPTACPSQLAGLKISFATTDHQGSKNCTCRLAAREISRDAVTQQSVGAVGGEMVRFQLHRFLCARVPATICIVALFLFFPLFPSAEAKQPCLRIALPEAAAGVVGPDIYREAMGEVGLCVDPLPMPNARAFMALRHKQIDGVFAMLEEFSQSAGTPVIRGSILLGNPDGILVVKKDGPKNLSELKDELIGVWLGTGWSEKLLAGYEHVIRVVGGPELMIEMLVKGRLDGLLVNAFSLGVQGGTPDGFVAIPVANLSVYSFLRAEHAEHLAKFDAGTARYREKIAAWREKHS